MLQFPPKTHPFSYIYYVIHGLFYLIQGLFCNFTYWESMECFGEKGWVKIKPPNCILRINFMWETSQMMRNWQSCKNNLHELFYSNTKGISFCIESE